MTAHKKGKIVSFPPFYVIYAIVILQELLFYFSAKNPPTKVVETRAPRSARAVVMSVR